MIRDGIFRENLPPTRWQKLDAWLRRHWIVDVVFVGIGGCALIVSALSGLAILGGLRVEEYFGLIIPLAGAAWLVPRLLRLRN